MTVRPRPGGLGLTRARTQDDYRTSTSALQAPLPRRRGTSLPKIEDSQERCRALVAPQLGVEPGVLDRADHALELDDLQERWGCVADHTYLARKRRSRGERAYIEDEETALMRDAQAGEAFVHSLSQLGSHIVLDDFGTGFGSFTYLTRMPVHYLKVDIQFVVGLPDKPANQQLVKAIVNLAQSLGHQSVAEGVEDEDTLDLLREYGVDYVQGFHIGRPAPLAC